MSSGNFDQGMSTPTRRTYCMGCSPSRSDLAMGRVSNSRLMPGPMWRSTTRSVMPPTAPSRSSTHRTTKTGAIRQRWIAPSYGRHVRADKLHPDSLEDEYETNCSSLCGQTLEDLAQADRLRLILITMNAGTNLRRHSRPSITIQPFSGRSRLRCIGGTPTPETQCGRRDQDRCSPFGRRRQDGAFRSDQLAAG